MSEKSKMESDLLKIDEENMNTVNCSKHFVEVFDEYHRALNIDNDQIMRPQRKIPCDEVNMEETPISSFSSEGTYLKTLKPTRKISNTVSKATTSNEEDTANCKIHSLWSKELTERRSSIKPDLISTDYLSKLNNDHKRVSLTPGAFLHLKTFCENLKKRREENIAEEESDVDISPEEDAKLLALRQRVSSVRLNKLKINSALMYPKKNIIEGNTMEESGRELQRSLIRTPLRIPYDSDVSKKTITSVGENKTKTILVSDCNSPMSARRSSNTKFPIPLIDRKVNPRLLPEKKISASFTVPLIFDQKMNILQDKRNETVVKTKIRKSNSNSRIMKPNRNSFSRKVFKEI